MFEHKRVHQSCTWQQDTLGWRSMIDFVVVSSDLWLYVLDTRVKRGAELSTDHHLVVSWIRWQRRKLDRPGQTQTYCEGLLGTSGRALCQGGLQLPPPEKLLTDSKREAGDIESEWTMFSASIVDAWQLEAVDTRSLVPVVAATPRTRWWTPEVRDAIRLKKESYGLLLQPVLWQKLGSGSSSVRPWRRTIGWPRRDSGKPSGASEGRSSTVPTLFTVQVVRKLLSGKAPGVDEIRPRDRKSQVSGCCGAVLADTPLQHCMRNNAVFVLSPGRGTLDQLYTLRRVLEGLWEFAQPVHMCFGIWRRHLTVSIFFIT
ncbi:hypothetical protein L3Q82_017286, partial [Scortum barcoo]